MAQETLKIDEEPIFKDGKQVFWPHKKSNGNMEQGFTKTRENWAS
jgi:hypothetical protein